MEVTEIILAVLRFLKDVLDKTAFVNIRCSNYFHTFKTTKYPKKNLYQLKGSKNLKKKIPEPKVSRLLPNFCDFQKENLDFYSL
jgi:hypothetical protein